MKYCDDNDLILEWSSEEIIIPYRSPVEGSPYRYFPDFWVRTPNGQTLIEIKPKIQTKPPKPSKNKRRYLREVKVWGVNENPNGVPVEYCENKGWNWKIITDVDLTKY